MQYQRVMSKKVYQGQSFFDKVIENTGSIDNAFEMALLNGMSITDDVVIGQELKIGVLINKSVVSFFGEMNRPATQVSEYQKELIESLGIGKMAIGSTFIVR